MLSRGCCSGCREAGWNRGWPDIDARGTGLRTTRARRMWGCGLLTTIVTVLLTLVAWPVHAQIFLASRPKPEFTIGPLSIRANVVPAGGPVEVTLLWSLMVPPTVGGAALEQDLYLLWPGAVDGEIVAGEPDPALRRTVEERGFQVAREGRLPLSARAVYSGPQRAKPEPLPGGAPFVTYTREAGPLGQPTPATWIRIPWAPRLVDRSFFVELRKRLARPRPPEQATWPGNFLWGERHLITLSFNDVRTRATFPMYLAYRDRVSHLADDPSQLTSSIAASDHLKINAVFP